MGYVVLTPDQFEYLDEALHSNKTVTDFQETGDYTGVITTHDVTLDYTYDPLKQILNFELGAKHSLAAKIAGDNVISNHIVALLHNLKYPTPAPKPIPSLTSSEPEVVPASNVINLDADKIPGTVTSAEGTPEILKPNIVVKEPIPASS